MPGLGTKEGTAFRQDLLINRPIAEPSLEGFFFFALDDNSGTLYQCNGEDWVPITGGLRGLVAGPGITLVSTPTTITINNTYSLPIATASILGGIKVGSGLAIDLGGILSVPDATTSVPGLVEIDRNPAVSHPISLTKYGLHRVPVVASSSDYLLFMGDNDTDYNWNSSFLYISTVNNSAGVDPLVYLDGGVERVRLTAAGRLNLTPTSGSGISLWINDDTTNTSFALNNAGSGELMRLVNNYNSGKTFLVDAFANLFMGGTIGGVNGVALTDGQLLIGNTSTGKMSVATLTAGSNITITNGPGNITITATGGGGGGTTIAPYVKAWRLASQTLTGTTNVRVGLDSTFIDVGTGTPQHDNVTNNSRLTCRLAGTYLIGAVAIGFANAGYNPTTEYQLTLARNGVGFAGTPFQIHPGGTYDGGSGATLLWALDLAVNDYIEMGVSVTGANPGDTFLLFPVGAPDGAPTLWMQYLGSGIGAGSIQHNGSLIGTRPKTNFIDGSNVTLTVADNPGSNRVDVTIASTGGGGGGGSGTDVDGKILIQAPNVSANIKDDEFNDSSGMSGPINGLDSKWSKHNLGTSSWLVFDDTIAPGCLAFTIPSGQTLDQAIYQTAPAGDFTIQVVFDPASAAHREMWYIFVVNTSGNGFGFGWDKADTYSIRQITAWQQSGTRFDTDLNPGSEAPQQLWFKKVGTNYTGAVSFSTRHRKIPNRHTVTTAGLFTPAYIGFGRVYDDGGSGITTMLLDAFRVT